MAKLVLYHAPVCPYARRSRITLEYLGIPYETKEIDLAAVPDSFREISPYGKVPAIIHDGKSLFESNVINEFLDETYHGGLMPPDPLGRAHARILMAFADRYWMPRCYRLKRALRDGAPEAELDGLRADLEDLLADLEPRFRGDGPFLLGSAPTLADFAFAPNLTELERWGVAVPPALVRVRAWRDALLALPAVRAVPTTWAVEVV